MQSNAKDVAASIQEASTERQAYLAKVRELCLEVLTGYEEAMAYGGPVYKRDGVIEAGFVNYASQSRGSYRACDPRV